MYSQNVIEYSGMSLVARGCRGFRLPKVQPRVEATSTMFESASDNEKQQITTTALEKCLSCILPPLKLSHNHGRWS